MLIDMAVLPYVLHAFHSSEVLITAERLQTNLIASLVSILLQAQTIQVSHLTSLQQRVSNATQALSNVNPILDQNLYISYNRRAFDVPNDWDWEPCAGYYDTGEMVIEPAPKVLLQNMLSRSRTKLEEAMQQLDPKREHEVRKYLRLIKKWGF